ncbi:unnamed protein product [Pieris macdunnoughi]|uniref:Uncharacterized protein n=1 Tax=Pieris macdunnoughi TaxID=345717 RepID=A0A821XTF9_9NEOP|nr:unnamed protein product [Pieris macdunnoughi]
MCNEAQIPVLDEDQMGQIDESSVTVFYNNVYLNKEPLHQAQGGLWDPILVVDCCHWCELTDGVNSVDVDGGGWLVISEGWGSIQLVCEITQSDTAKILSVKSVFVSGRLCVFY